MPEIYDFYYCKTLIFSEPFNLAKLAIEIKNAKNKGLQNKTITYGVTLAMTPHSHCLMARYSSFCLPGKQNRGTSNKTVIIWHNYRCECG